MNFGRLFLQTLAKNPISTFAVLCVACTAAFLGYMTLRMSAVLESSSWCGNAIQAEKITPGPTTYVGLTTCVDLLKIQLQAMATGFHISVGAFAFSLIVLVVIVVAGARASGKLGATGVQFDVGKHEADKAAQHVADEAQGAADEVKAEGAPATPDAGLPESLR
jgi:hypothetical protein